MCFPFSVHSVMISPITPDHKFNQNKMYIPCTTPGNNWHLPAQLYIYRRPISTKILKHMAQGNPVFTFQPRPSPKHETLFASLYTIPVFLWQLFGRTKLLDHILIYLVRSTFHVDIFFIRTVPMWNGLVRGSFTDHYNCNLFK